MKPMNALPMKVKRVTEVDVPGLGTAIKRAREADTRQLSELCRLAKMTTTNWYRIENEEIKSLPVDTLRAVEFALGISFGVEI